MKQGLVSIIVPVYNVRKYIERCLSSLVNQTYSLIEILLINDGSSDDSDLICEQYQTRYQQIRYFTKKNEGLSKTRNFGIEKAAGEYLLFVDSDDYIELDMVEKMIQCAMKEQADLVIGSYRMDYPFFSLCRRAPKYQVWEPVDAIKALLHNRTVSNFAWGKLYRTSLWKDIRFPSCRFEDVYTTYRLFIKANRIVTMPDRFYHYVQRKGSIMNQNGLLALDMPIVCEMRRAFEEQERMINEAFPFLHAYNLYNYYTSDMLMIYTMIFFVKRSEIVKYPLPYLKLDGLPLILQIAYHLWRGCAKIKFGKKLLIEEKDQA
ncbi:glycosyltransferase family 2 protein [Merdibacter massiliensis]|uniref:glycosyltransferase family 2 protein n=1 Tax=Merdibacter massiliensis TaxID=1871030 RepID=UPI00096A6D5C|nr:glycosyltransferase family 2 protein [Merdibacter massiliensis]